MEMAGWLRQFVSHHLHLIIQPTWRIKQKRCSILFKVGVVVVWLGLRRRKSPQYMREVFRQPVRM